MSNKKRNILDDLTLRRFIAAGLPIARSDGDGLTFTLTAAGHATWILRYRYGGRAREMTLGAYPALTLAAARKQTRDLRTRIDAGEDPAGTKQQEKARAVADWTVRELAADFKAKQLVGLSDVTVYYRTKDIDEVFVPALGARPVRSVTSADIVHAIESADRTWTITRRLLTSGRKLFGHACGKRLIVANPCAGIELSSLVGKRPPVRKRLMLTTAELHTLLGDIEQIGTENALAFRILLATCVRSVELVKAEWQYVDLERGTWWVPDEAVKTRKGFMVPLTPTVVGWFEQLKQLAGESKWVLPARRANRAGAHVGRTTLWAAISRSFARGQIDIRRFTPHDTRSTAKGHMRNLGVSREISEVALNHVLRGMEGIYDVREEIPERRAALELWAAFIVECEAGRDWNVRPLGKRA